MIRINLLPYRDARRRNQILKYVMVALSGLAVSVLLLLAAHSWSRLDLSQANDNLKQIQQQNMALKEKIGDLSKFKEVQDDVEKKLELVDKLQRGRFRSLQSLQALSESIPKNVWLTQVTDHGETISISGFGESNRAVSSFMRALEDQKFFSGVSLQVIKREDVNGIALRSFSLNLNRIDEASPAASEDEAAGKNGGKES